MIDGMHCNLCYLDLVAGGSQCSDYYPGGSLLPDSDNDGLWTVDVHPAGDHGDHDHYAQPPLQQVHDPVPDTGVQILCNIGIPGYSFPTTR